jgi:hypothetical protein
MELIINYLNSPITMGTFRLSDFIVLGLINNLLTLPIFWVILKITQINIGRDIVIEAKEVLIENGINPIRLWVNPYMMLVPYMHMASTLYRAYLLSKVDRDYKKYVNLFINRYK